MPQHLKSMKTRAPYKRSAAEWSPETLLPVEALHHVAGVAVFLQHHGDGLRVVESRVAQAAALGVDDERLLELIGEADSPILIYMFPNI